MADKNYQCMHYEKRTETGRGMASSRCPSEAMYRISGERKEIYWRRARAVGKGCARP
jgi:hypothetical protein